MGKLKKFVFFFLYHCERSVAIPYKKSDLPWLNAFWIMSTFDIFTHSLGPGLDIGHYSDAIPVRADAGSLELKLAS